MEGAAHRAPLSFPQKAGQVACLSIQEGTLQACILPTKMLCFFRRANIPFQSFFPGCFLLNTASKQILEFLQGSFLGL